MIKVVVVDDHAVVREGLKRIVSESGGMTVTGEAADGHEALRVIKSEPCDVVLQRRPQSVAANLPLRLEM